jgi:antagonist of KipI
VKILDPGLMTTVQDLGRVGYQKDGITSSGAMDPLALRIANALVGNAANEAGLEATLKGPTIEFRHNAVISICGADLSPEIADVRLPNWRAILVMEGAVLRFGEAEWGCRAYLGVAGGIDVPEVMNSKSTYLRAAVGGFEGRSLRAGDNLAVGSVRTRAPSAARFGPLPFVLAEQSVLSADALGLYELNQPVRVVRGPHIDMFDERERNVFLEESFEVSTSSDRMGYRLAGPRLDSSEREELVSSAVLAGTVQVPPSGEPIVLMADRQTTGGYPVIGIVASADLPRVAQMRPGDGVRFAEVSLQRAQVALRSQAQWVRELKKEVTT